MNVTSPIKEKKFQFSMIFPDRMNRLWTFLKDSNKVQYVINKTQILLSNLNKNSLKCCEFVTNNYYKAISYSYGHFLLKFSIYPNTLDNSSLVIHEVISQNENNSLLPNNFLEQSPKRFLEALQLYLKENPVFLYEYQSILLNCEIVKMLDYLINESDYSLDFFNQKNNAKSTSNNSQLHSPKKVGDKFIYKFGTSSSFNEMKYAIVTKIEQDLVKKQWYFSFDLYHSNEYAHPYCSVNFFILIIKENQIFLTFHHEFNESIEQSQLNLLAQTKKTFLSYLKKYFEGS